MSPASIQKICFVCGANVANRPRTKDQLGRYYCNPCWTAASETTVVKENETDADALSELAAQAQKSSPVGSNLDAQTGVVSRLNLLSKIWSQPKWIAIGVITICGLAFFTYATVAIIDAIRAHFFLATTVSMAIAIIVYANRDATNYRLLPRLTTLLCVVLACIFATYGIIAVQTNHDDQSVSKPDEPWKSYSTPSSGTVADMQAAARKRAAADAIADAAAAKQKAIDDADKAATLRALESPPRNQIATDSVRSNPDYNRARAFLLAWAKQELDEESQAELSRTKSTAYNLAIQRAQTIGDVSAADVEKALNESLAANVEDQRQLEKIQYYLKEMAREFVPFALLKAVSRDIQADETVDEAVRDHLRVRLSGR